MEGYKTNEKAQNNDFDTLSHKTGILFHIMEKKRKKKENVHISRVDSFFINCEE